MAPTIKPVIEFELHGKMFYFKVREHFTFIDNSDYKADADRIEEIKNQIEFLDALKYYIKHSESLGEFPVKDGSSGNNLKTVICDGKTDCIIEFKKALKTENALIILQNADMVFNKYEEFHYMVYSNSTSIFVLEGKNPILYMGFHFRECACIYVEDNKHTFMYYDEYQEMIRGRMK